MKPAEIEHHTAAHGLTLTVVLIIVIIILFVHVAKLLQLSRIHSAIALAWLGRVARLHSPSL